jgi:hypothetical protein
MEGAVMDKHDSLPPMDDQFDNPEPNDGDKENKKEDATSDSAPSVETPKSGDVKKEDPPADASNISKDDADPILGESDLDWFADARETPKLTPLRAMSQEDADAIWAKGLAFAKPYLEVHAAAMENMPLGFDSCRINFGEYLKAYLCAMWRELPPADDAKRRFFGKVTPIASDDDMTHCLREIYADHHTVFPAGLDTLPIWWGRPLIREMAKPVWRTCKNNQWQITFGWCRVRHTADGYLEITYPHPIPISYESWAETFTVLIRLHMHFDPGPFTGRERLLEFTVDP